MSSMGTSFLSMMEARMPPGFRFHPRDEELINDYLARKISGGPNGCTPMMIDVDLNKIEPWELPEEACVGGKEWYFYSLRDRKYATGQRTNRATVSGYWKATGKDRQVVDGRRGGRLVGMRKTLVFYKGRAPKGKKTDWVMHEFRMEGSNNDALTARSGIDHYNKPSSSSSTSSKEDWVLCRVFYKSRGLSAKPSGTATTAAAPAGSENCYDDTGSSLPPLMDTFINFEQPLHQHQLAAYMQHQQQGSAAAAAYPHHPQQVPCFSSLLPSSSSNSHRQLPAAFQHHLPSQLPPVDPSMPIRSLTQLVSLPDISPYLSSLSRMEGVRKTEDVAAPPANNNLGGADGSSESFLTEAGAGGGGQPMWSSY